jgi:hypothetical protein
LAESHYPQALDEFNALDEPKHHSRRQWSLIGFLRKLGRSEEVLQLLLQMLIGYFSPDRRSIRPIEDEFLAVIEALKEWTAEVEIDGNCTDIKASLQYFRRLVSPYLYVWEESFSELFTFAGAISVLGFPERAEFIFSFALSHVSLLRKNPKEEARAHKEYVRYCQRQNKWSKSFYHLQLALTCLSTTNTPDDAFLADFGQLLGETKRHFPADYHHLITDTESARLEWVRCLEKEKRIVKLKRNRQDIGDWVLPNDDDGFSVDWTTSSGSRSRPRSSRSYKYGVTYSPGQVTGISDSEFMVP